MFTNRKDAACDPNKSYFSPISEVGNSKMGFIRERTGGSFIGFLLLSTLRLLQLVFALAVIGLYAQDIDKAHRQDPPKYTDSKWAFATVVSTLAAFTALVYGLLPIFLSSASIALLCVWDLILFILWTAVFGLFGSMYIGEKTEMDSGIQRMKNAVWVDLINMLLWLVSTGIGATGFWKWLKGGRSLHTGRARV